jgi:hypothetical protein
VLASVLRRRYGAPPCGDRHGGIAMLKDFRVFILRGSLVDLAVAVVIGTAFGAVAALARIP